MTRPARILLAVAVLALLVNVGGAAAAAMMGEPMHTTVHAVLAVFLGVALWAFAMRRHRARRASAVR